MISRPVAHRDHLPKTWLPQALLEGAGLKRVAEVQWDDWYVHPAVHNVEEAAAKAQQAASASQLQAPPARATHQKGA